MVRDEYGFTFKELLIVVAIIGLFVAIATPALSSLVGDADVKEFTSNARSVEEGAQTHYRDTGVLPLSERAETISESSEEIIKSQLRGAGVSSPSRVLDALQEDHLYFVDRDALRDYTRVAGSYDRVDEFIIVNMVDLRDEEMQELAEDYDNELSGYVFSVDTVEDSSDNVYSGAYTWADGSSLFPVEDSTTYDPDTGTVDREFDEREDEGEEFWICPPGVDRSHIGDDAAEKGCRPAETEETENGTVIVKDIGEGESVAVVDPEGIIVDIIVDMGMKSDGFAFERFSLRNIDDNGNGTADVSVVFNNRLVDEEGNRLADYRVGGFQLSTNTGVSEVLGEEEVSFTVRGVRYGTNLEVTLEGVDVYHREVGDIGAANVREVAQLELDASRDTSENVNDDLEEDSTGEEYDSRNELYKVLQERSGYQVTVEGDGLVVSGIEEGDRLVLKEMRKSGDGYRYDENRTRLFRAKGSEVGIPKDPYLQRDFQENPDTEYAYVVEVYDDVEVDEGEEKNEAAHAKMVRYK